jgi:hypothetical protein
VVERRRATTAAFRAAYPEEHVSFVGYTVWTDSLARPRTIAAEPRRPLDRAERRLVARLRSRDPDALAEAYRAYGAATFGLLLRLLGDRGAA